jgi:hypothetical protein
LGLGIGQIAARQFVAPPSGNDGAGGKPAFRRAALAVAMTRKDADALRDFTFARKVVVSLSN